MRMSEYRACRPPFDERHRGELPGASVPSRAPPTEGKERRGAGASMAACANAVSACAIAEAAALPSRRGGHLGSTVVWWSAVSASAVPQGASRRRGTCGCATWSGSGRMREHVFFMGCGPCGQRRRRCPSDCGHAPARRLARGLALVGACPSGAARSTAGLARGTPVQAGTSLALLLEQASRTPPPESNDGRGGGASMKACANAVGVCAISEAAACRVGGVVGWATPRRGGRPSLGPVFRKALHGGGAHEGVEPGPVRALA